MKTFWNLMQLIVYSFFIGAFFTYGATQAIRLFPIEVKVVSTDLNISLKVK